ncbi:MAG: hypothetical protein F6K11_10650, partial [Leptolyngbya sp. SIO3F4]|nr:hypothetical protein [Leptolyngbya sp. SIO3F4]
MSWYITSQQTSGFTNTYGNSKMAFDANTGNYVFCVEYRVVSPFDPLELFSSASGPTGLLAPGQYGLLNIHVDGSGNILNVCSVVTSSSPVRLGDIALDENTGMVYVTGHRTGAVSNAFVLSYMPGTCAGGTGISAGFANNSWGRGIDVEASEVFVVGDYENTVTWGSFTGTALATASQDIYVVKFDPALNPMALTVAEAQFYGEGYDVAILPGSSEIYVSGSVELDATAWNVGNFGASFPGALHGFIQVFDPVTLASTCNFVRVPATNNNEFFKIVDIEKNVSPVTGNTGVLTIGGNMNHGGPMYDFYTGCALSSSTPLTAPVQEAGFVLRVDGVWIPQGN